MKKSLKVILMFLLIAPLMLILTACVNQGEKIAINVNNTFSEIEKVNISGDVYEEDGKTYLSAKGKSVTISVYLNYAYEVTDFIVYNNDVKLATPVTSDATVDGLHYMVYIFNIHNVKENVNITFEGTFADRMVNINVVNYITYSSSYEDIRVTYDEGLLSNEDSHIETSTLPEFVQFIQGRTFTIQANKKLNFKFGSQTKPHYYNPFSILSVGSKDNITKKFASEQDRTNGFGTTSVSFADSSTLTINYPVEYDSTYGASWDVLLDETLGDLNSNQLFTVSTSNMDYDDLKNENGTVTINLPLFTTQPGLYEGIQFAIGEYKLANIKLSPQIIIENIGLINKYASDEALISGSTRYSLKITNVLKNLVGKTNTIVKEELENVWSTSNSHDSPYFAYYEFANGVELIHYLNTIEYTITRNYVPQNGYEKIIINGVEYLPGQTKNGVTVELTSSQSITIIITPNFTQPITSMTVEFVSQES